jgi:hypothetical protein
MKKAVNRVSKDELFAYSFFKEIVNFMNINYLRKIFDQRRDVQNGFAYRRS